MKLLNICSLLNSNSYVGRGILIGKSEDGKKAVFGYFIMGRSNNSRNRIFVEKGEEVVIHPFNEDKVEDSSLIIYYPIKKYENKVIVTNGDHTDTIYEGYRLNRSFEDSLRLRCFEPDEPNYTPRISGEVSLEENFKYKMSILKAMDEDGYSCMRNFFDFEPLKGVGHFIHTYEGDGNPLPSFNGEPKAIEIPNNIEEFANNIWQNLNEDNKISLYVKSVDLIDKTVETYLFNKNLEEK